MLAGRLVAAADVPARATDAQMHNQGLKRLEAADPPRFSLTLAA